MKNHYCFNTFIMLIIWGFITPSYAQKLLDQNKKVIIKSMESNWYSIKKGVEISKEELLQKEAQFLGVQSSENLLKTKVIEDELGFIHTKYQQTYNGFPVEGSQIIVHERNNKVEKINGQIEKNLKIKISTSISESSALASAMLKMKAKNYMWEVEAGDNYAKAFGFKSRDDYFPKAELVILPSKITKSDAKLTYKFLIHSGDLSQVKYVYVDANNGNVLLQVDAMESTNQDGIAHTKYVGTKAITTDHFEGGFRLKENRGATGVLLHTMNANKQDDNTGFLSNLTEFVDADNNWNNINEDQDEEATDIHWGQEVTYDYFFQVHGRNSVDGQGGDMLAFGHFGQNIYNATSGNFGPRGAQATRFGDGPSGNGLTMLDVVGHEIGHSVVRFSANLSGAGNWVSRGLNESFADIFGVSMGFWIGQPEENIWVLGDEVDGIGIRNMSDPNSYGDPDTWKGNFWDFDQSTSVHKNGNVQDYWYYLLVVGGSGVNDNGDAYDVTPIPIEKAEKIAYRNLVTYLTPTSQYPEARAGSLQAAEDLYGISSPEYSAVANAWYAVGVGSQVSATDFGVVGFDALVSTCEFLTNSEDVTLIVKYFGGTNVIPIDTQIPVSLSFNNGVEIDEIIITTESITGGDSIKYTFSQTVDLSAGGFFNFKAKVSFENDLNDLNDFVETNIETASGPSNDVGVISIVSPDVNSQTLTDSETISVNVHNYSCITIPSGTIIPLSYALNGATPIEQSLSLSEDLLSETSTEFTFDVAADFTTSGSFVLNISTNLSTDPKQSNNTFTASFGALSVFPYFEDFESGSGGWSHQELKGTDVWELGTPSQGSINSASSGINAWMTDLGANYPDLSKMTLESPFFDFSQLQAPQFCFDMHFQTEAEWDAMVVESSADGSTWTKMNMPDYNSTNNQGTTVTIDQPWYSGTNNGWKKSCINLNDLAGSEKIKFRFHFESDEGSNDEGVAIDNVGINEIPDLDLAVTKIVSPLSGDELSSTQDIVIELTNLGNTEDLTFDLSYKVNDESVVTESTTMTIGFEQSVNYTFNTKADMSANGNHILGVAISLANDFNTSNDSILDVTIFNNKPFSVPYAETFDEFTSNSAVLSNGWENATDDDGDYTVVSIQPTTDSDGNPLPPSEDHTTGEGLFLNSVVINGDNTEIDALFSPEIDLTGLTSPLAEFWIVQFENGNTAAGETPGSISLDVFDTEWNDDVWTTSANNHNDWQRTTVDLSSFSGVVRFRFRNTNNTAQASLFALDDFVVKESVTNDASVINIKAPISTSCLSDSESLVVEIENLGEEEISNFDISYSVEFEGSTNSMTETVNSAIAPGEILRYTFTNKIDLSSLGVYTISVESLLIGDQKNENNTAITIMEHQNPTALDFIENFDDFNSINSLEFLNGWFNDLSSDIEWQTANSTPTADTGPTGDHTGNGGNFIYVEASGDGFPSKKANLLSPCFDITNATNPQLEFWYHMQSDRDDEDHMGSLAIDVFDGTWTEDVWTVSGHQGQSWKSQLIDLSAFNSPIRFRFSVVTGDDFTSDVALDDIKVFNGPAIDIGVTEVLSPLSGCGLDLDTEIKINLKNFGTDVISAGSIQVSYAIDQGSAVTETIDTEISAFGELVYTFTSKEKITPGNHSIVVSVSLAADEDINNDILSQTFVANESNVLFIDASLSSCIGETIVLEIAAEGVASVEWSPTVSGNRYIATESGTVSATVTYINGCTSTDNVEIVFNDVPELEIAAGNICGTTVTLDPGSFVSYLWHDETTNRNFQVTEDGVYFVTVIDENGCYGTAGGEMLLNPIPDPSFSFEDSGNNIYTFTPNTTENHSFLWNFGNGNTSSNKVATNKYFEIGTFPTELTVTTSADCSSSSTQNIEILVLGLDEIKTISDLNLFPNPAKNNFNLVFNSIKKQILQLSIFNPLGQQVYQSKEIELSNGEKFNESFKLNVDTNPGFYFLLIENENGESSKRKLLILD